MDTETATNPVEGAEDFEAFEAAIATETEVEEPVADEDAQQYDEDGNLIEEVVDEDEEVDLGDDLKLKVPKTAAEKLKALKDGALMQADYTRKTQALAAREKELESIQQATDGERQAEFVARSLAAQLQQFSQVNWAAEIQRAQQEYDQGYDDRRSAVAAAKAQFDQTKDAFQQAAGQYQGLRQQREFQAQQATAKLLDEGRAAVAKIPGWSEQVGQQLKDVATSPEIGFTADEIGDEHLINPKVAKALLLAKEALDNRRNAKKTQNLAAGQVIKPIPTVKGSSGATPIRADTSDFKAFERMAQKQLAKG